MEKLSSQIVVDILVNGKKIKQYTHDNRIYIEAKEGSEYEIKIHNSSWIDILAIATVDGVNVLDGKNGGDSEAGYIISQYDTYHIKGYRYNNDSVGAFKFVKREDSYAKDRTGTAKNCGVIGVKAYWRQTLFNQLIDTYHPIPTFPKTTPRWNEWTINDAPYDDPYYGDSNVMYSSCLESSSNGGGSLLRSCSLSNKAETSSFDLGSSWGEKKDSKVVDAEFIKGSFAGQLEIFYASREALIEMGIPLIKEAKVVFPESFPKFCEPPKGWKKS